MAIAKYKWYKAIKRNKRKRKATYCFFQQVDREQKKMAEKNNIPQFVNSDSFMADTQIDFLYQAGTKLQKVDNATTPMPDLLQFVPWRHQTVIVSKCDTINAAIFYLNKVVEDNMSRIELEHVTNLVDYLKRHSIWQEI